ncbi:hypothetical protein KR52_11725 [Synechococcus sp. KORDI-52]|nr:hypothetical protein KR52_11725 [Synechococcus sp. KORDI-52]
MLAHLFKGISAISALERQQVFIKPHLEDLSPQLRAAISIY